jgi:hypothetical protein
MGVDSEYLPLGFEPSILKEIPNQSRKYDVTFVGGISPAHKQGFKLLNTIADRLSLEVWGYGKETLSPDSRLFRSHHGEVWGKDMYKIFLQSKITINRHIDVAENYANNARLYEATGCGALLITDEKANLGELFKVGKEVITYQNEEDLADKVKYYLKHDRERNNIAAAGQKRTIKCHNYRERMKTLNKIIKRYM